MPIYLPPVKTIGANLRRDSKARKGRAQSGLALLFLNCSNLLAYGCAGTGPRAAPAGRTPLSAIDAVMAGAVTTSVAVL
jgi:hypothetical protein